MIIYKLINNMPVDILWVLCKFIDNNMTPEILLKEFRNNIVLRLLNKEHYNESYSYFYERYYNKMNCKKTILISMIRNKAKINFINYITNEKRMKENCIINYKNTKYKSLFYFIKSQIIYYNSFELLPYLLETN
tara:strand:- start:191 stop:592 length:402 start_codon:yes stop_codon:yes gene_type:complete